MPAGVYRRPDLRSRFEAKVDRSGDCHLWTGSRGSAGYGQLAVDGRPRGAHRVSWELERGPVPKGMDVCHRCDVKLCVRIEHLFTGTQSENLADMRRKQRHAVGERHGNSALTADLVLAIRRLSPVMSHARIAKALGVGKSAVQAVLDGKTWRHLKSK